jgi:CMP-N,N'-diacetyllegionaminic acid synthase
MSKAAKSVVALIPARAGSARLPDKNVKLLAGQPLIAYTISAALDSGVFESVVVSTDSESYAEIARQFGAEVPFLRPESIAGSLSPDVEWVTHALEALSQLGRRYDCFSILRPTSPFRLPETIRRAWETFRDEVGADSLRAVEKCRQHPGKMWVVRGRRMTPLMPLTPADRPWHSSQYQSLPEVYVQNASLEIAYSRVAMEGGTIAGETVIPFITEGYEGLDINEPKDWWYAEHLINAGEAKLPEARAPRRPGAS